MANHWDPKAPPMSLDESERLLNGARQTASDSNSLRALLMMLMVLIAVIAGIAGVGYWIFIVFRGIGRFIA